MTIGHDHGHNQLKGDFLCWQTLLFFSNVNGIECYTNWAKFEQFSFHRSSATLREQENFTSMMSPRRRKSLNQIQSLGQVMVMVMMMIDDDDDGGDDDDDDDDYGGDDDDDDDDAYGGEEFINIDGQQ